ncbi:hypothetical protein BKA65DRAFT_21837 [Rhexocercosporidium sp. MPI-PUGE-AT-0058]|nr:hypothetical protein BKA65DRAFT_21837 [Rhexocercosporidium sp. MPI-PUGE-AT-0058]
MLLIDLHQEIIDLVIDFLGLSGEPRDLCGLALSCRTLHRSARSAVPKFLSLYRPSVQFDLFQRTLDEDPTYGNGVRSLTLHRPNVVVEGGSHLTREQLEAFLLRFPDVRSLHLKEHYVPGSGDSILFQCRNHWKSLRELSLSDPKMTLSDLLEMIALPQLRYLNAAHLNFMDIPRDLNIPFRRSELRSLDLRSSRVEVEVLGIILQGIWSLRILRYKMPRRSGSMAMSSAAQLNIDYTIYKYRATSALLNSASTLTRLDFGIQSRRGRIVPDSEMIDLSRFIALKELRICALYFFTAIRGGVRAIPSTPSRNGLYRFLPPALEALQIQFPSETGVFYRNPIRGSPERDRFVQNNMDEALYEWITEFAIHKSESLPSLRSIWMVESQHSPRMNMVFDLEAWDPPCHVKELFDEAGIDLNVHVRKPRTSTVNFKKIELPDIFER